VLPSYVLLREVSKHVDNRMAEAASDVNVKPKKMQSLVETLPNYARSLKDWLSAALDVYFEEFRTSSGPSGSGGNPPPVTIHTWLERFNKQKPRSFEKETAPVDAKNWISHMMSWVMRMHSRLDWLYLSHGEDLRCYGCEDAFKTRLALYKSTLIYLMCMSYTDVAQVANAARNYEILHERDDEDTERPDKRQRSGDRHQPTSQQSSHRSHGHNNDRHGSDRRGGNDNHRASNNNNYSGSNNRNSGNGRDQRNMGHQSNRSANSGNSS
nr:hypothetical protein [Tanacetum cinerariifolium]